MERKSPVVVGMDTKTFYYDKDNEPAAYIKSGDEVIFFSEDANVSLITEESHIWNDFQKLVAAGGGCNPVTGPVYVEGAKAGGCIAVEILDVKAGEERGGGYSSLYPGLGALSNAGSIQADLEARTKICKIEGDQATFKHHNDKKPFKFDLNRFVGSIGVAPKEERRFTYYGGKEFCGNVDCPDVKAGATIIMPANVDGALLSLGDIHGAQGDGEITGCALECRGETRVRVTAMSREEAKYCDWPQCNTEEEIGAIICDGGNNLTDQIRKGYVELVKRMVKYYGFDALDAYQLLNLVGRVRIGQLGGDMNSCVVKIARKYLEQ